MERYMDKKTKKVIGYSKWFFNDGNYEWKKCEVLEYDK